MCHPHPFRRIIFELYYFDFPTVATIHPASDLDSDNTMRAVVVTGAAGAIGAACCRRLFKTFSSQVRIQCALPRSWHPRMPYSIQTRIPSHDPANRSRPPSPYPASRPRLRRHIVRYSDHIGPGARW